MRQMPVVPRTTLEETAALGLSLPKWWGGAPSWLFVYYKAGNGGKEKGPELMIAMRFADMNRRLEDMSKSAVE